MALLTSARRLLARAMEDAHPPAISPLEEKSTPLPAAFPGREPVKPSEFALSHGAKPTTRATETDPVSIPLGPQLSRAEIQATFRDGLNALKRARLAEAEQLLALTLRRDPDHVAARINLALVYEKVDPREAIE